MLETEQYLLREAQTVDAEFILKLLNQPAWKKYIYDHDINTIELAKDYIETKLQAMYRELGFGLWVAVSKHNQVAQGVCGLLKRESLDCMDLGFGFLSDYWGTGVAYEASEACLKYAFDVLKAPKVVAITNPENGRSIGLLNKLGFEFERSYIPPESDEHLSLYALESPH